MTIVAAILFLGFIMAALYKVLMSTGSFNEEGLRKAQARYAALAAINRGFAELEKDPSWRKGWPSEQPLHQNPHLRYKLRVLENVSQAQLSGHAKTGPLGWTSPSSGMVASGPDEVYLFAQGFTEHGAGQALAAAGGTAYRPKGQSSEACFTDGALTIINGSTDGFDSRKGEHWYNPGETDDTKKTLVQLSGHIGSNQSVTLSDTEVDGDLILPKPESFKLKGVSHGATSNLEMSGSTIKGKEIKPKAPREVPEVDPPFEDDNATAILDESNFGDLDDSEEPALPDKPVAKVLKPGAYDALIVPPGKVLELRSGTYYFKSALVLEDVVVTLKGHDEVRIFIGETMSVSNSHINPSSPDPDNRNKKPADLQLLFADKQLVPETEEHFSTFEVSNSTISAVVVGAKLQVKLTDSEYFGAIQSSTIVAESTQFHYDLALEDLELRGFSKWKIRSITALPPETKL